MRRERPSRTLFAGIVLVCLLVPLQQAAGGTATRKAPGAPTNLHVTAASATSVSVAWQPARGKSSLPAGYDVYRNGSWVATTSSTAFTFSTLDCGTAYAFGVVAFNRAGARSQMAQITASTTLCAPPPPPPPPPPPSPSADVSPPTTPTGLVPSSSTGSAISLAWSASADDVGVAGYDVYKNSSTAGNTSLTSYTVSGLACGTTYTLGVDAFDAAGNHSGTATVTAGTAPCPDTSAPTAPTLLTPSGATSTSLSFAWNPSFDNVGVAGYGIYRNSSRVNTTTGLNYTLTGLSCGTSYTIGVDAYDAAGNRSPQTALTMATTPCPSLTVITQSMVDGSKIAGAVPWSSSVSSGTASKVDYYVDGTLKWTDSAAPYFYAGDGDALDTTTLPDGSHSFKVTAVYGDGTTASNTISATVANAAVSPPPKGGYFTLQPVGSWSSLPSGATCAQMVHRSPWEPRPENYKRNHYLVDPNAVHQAFANHQKSVDGTYDPKWDSWLLPRIDGQFQGTTDEIFQWAACKWGLPDDVIRSVAVRESTWYQYLTYPSDRCVTNWGCGDFFPSVTAASAVYCDTIAQLGGYDYQNDYGTGQCPKTFSILGVMSWWNPTWGYNWPDNQAGQFPFNRNSTAFAADYYGSEIRGCFEGWQWELGSTYRASGAGDLWGCVGAWYSGLWHDSAGDAYAGRVQNELANFTWLQPGWPSDQPSCSTTYGCPGPDQY
jgi:chitodextrinase